jgi:hypothetical protein
MRSDKRRAVLLFNRESAFLSIFGILLCFLHTTADAQQDSTATADSLLLQSLQRQMSAQSPAPVQQAAPRSAPSTNPNMSAIGDFRALFQSPARRHVDAEFHEAEIALQSVVDPYARADFFLSIARDPATGKFGIDLEEGYLTTLDLPVDLQLKAGKFRSTFGKINNIHPHALPFIDVPNVYANYFGDEGLNDEGLSLSWLVPNPLEFYQELTVEATRGPSESPSFALSPVDRFLYLGHLKNFWDLTDNATLELGISGVTGPNGAAFTTVISGVDLTYKWKPLQFNTYQSFVFQVEALWADKKVTEKEKIQSWGMYGLATYQLSKRWFLTGRFDYSNKPDNALFVERAYSSTLGWYATEFQKVELEFKATTSNTFAAARQLVLRSVFVIGAHGAHAY